MFISLKCISSLFSSLHLQSFSYNIKSETRGESRNSASIRINVPSEYIYIQDVLEAFRKLVHNMYATFKIENKLTSAMMQVIYSLG